MGNILELCGKEYASCLCMLPKDHESTIHVCSCSGMWEVDGDMIRIHQFPLASNPFNLPLPSPWGKV